MAEYGYVRMPESSPDYSRKTAIAGIGESDFHDDYRAERQRPEGWEAPSPEKLAKLAFDRALADSGLKHADIDTLAVSFTYGGPAPEEMAQILGVRPKRAYVNGHIMAGPLPAACGEIVAGNADVVALVYSVASRAIGRQYGGSTYGPEADAGPASYYYYHPWGWSSQAAHWALMATHYQNVYGTREEDLGAVPMQIREHAAADPNAVMQKPFSIEEYMASRYIVRPLHLFDMCLVNDGAVCLIVTRADMARDLPHDPVLVAGWSETYLTQSKFEIMVRQRLRPIIADAGARALAMAGLTLDEVGHFEGYDASSIHLVNQVEGYGFTAPGTGIGFCRTGR